MTIILDKNIPNFDYFIKCLKYPFNRDRITFIYHNDNTERNKSLIEKLSEKFNIDVITCNGSILNFTGKNIRTTSCNIGNGYWKFANGDSIEDEYFNENIKNYTNILGSTAPPIGDISTGLQNGSVKIAGLKYIPEIATYKLENSILWPYSSTEDAYILLTNGQVFNGNDHKIKVGIDSNGINYGIFLCNALTNNGTSPIIKNLTVESTVSGEENGGVIRSGSSHFTLSHVTHKGQIDVNAISCGGLIGANSTAFLAKSCLQKGDINGAYCGGIYAGITNSTAINCIISRCDYKGNITGQSSAGIFGSSVQNISIIEPTIPLNPLEIIIKRCNSKGKLIGGYSSGIASDHIGISQIVDIYKCSFDGELNGDDVGGIAGFNSNANISECEVNGNINGKNSGGIVASSCFSNILSCIYKGNIIGSNSGGIAGSKSYVNINNSIVSGNVVGRNSGGFISYIGTDFQDLSVAIYNSIYKGDVIGFNAGGFSGNTIIESTNTLSIENCYTLGNSLEYTAGIIYSSLSPVTITNTYVHGLYTTAGIAYNSINVTVNNCYSYDLSIEGTKIIGMLKGSLSDLPELEWEKTDAYPMLKVFTKRPFKNYNKFNHLPHLI